MPEFKRRFFFCLMPTTMPHTGVQQNLQYIQTLDRRIQNIPEVELTVGKWGRKILH